jgi:O-antigen/teichoic acid export membrane protein
MISVEDFGRYTFALSFATIFSVFIDIGLTQALIREVAKLREKGTIYLTSTLLLKGLLSILVYGAIIVAINLMGYSSEVKNLVYVSAVIMVLDQFTLSFWGVFRGFQNLKFEAISVVINQVLIVIAGFTVLFLHLPLISLMVPFVIGSTFNLIFSFVNVKRKLKIKLDWHFDKTVIKFLLKLSVPFAMIAIFSRIYGYIDSVMLSKLVGDKAVGLYSAAMKLPFALQFIPAALAAAIFPAFTANFVSDKEQLRRTFDRVMNVLILLVVPISAGTIVLAEPIVRVFFSAKYLLAVPSLEILMVGLIFVFLNFPLGSLLNGCEKQVTNTVIVGCIMVFNIVLNIFLIPRYSFIGASIAFCLCHALLFFVSMIIARKVVDYDGKKMFISFAKTIISAIVMTVPLYFLVQQLNVVFLIFLGIVIYLGMIVLTGAVAREDREYIFNTLKKRFNA